MKLIARFMGGFVHGPDLPEQCIVVRGKPWYFDFDWQFGPLWTRKNGKELKNQHPPQAVWDEFDKWLKKQQRPKERRPRKKLNIK